MSICDHNATTDGKQTSTIGDDSHYQMLQPPPHATPSGQRDYFEQRRRAIITELRALDTMLGRTQTIPLDKTEKIK